MASPSTIIRKPYEAVAGALEEVGRQLGFAGRVLVQVPAVFRPKRMAVVMNLMSDITIGAGALIVGGGMIFVIFSMSFFVGTEVGLQGFKGLEQIGAQAFTGLVGSFANTREVTPIIAGVAFAAQVGAGFTAELGAMRISNEIDALEVMGLPSMRYLVSTRLIASMIVVLPLYVIGLYIMLLTTKFTSVVLFHVPSGTYSEYFNLYLQRLDVIYSVLKIVIFISLVTFIHCTYGFYASGGPEGVGRAVGRSVRLSVTLIFVVNFILSMMFWGGGTSVRFSG